MAKILLISHGNAISGAIDRFEDYLLYLDHEVFKLQHPLDNYSNQYTQLTKNHESLKRHPRHQLSLFNYIIDTVLSLKTVFAVSPDLIVGANNIDSFAAIFANKVLFRHTPVIFFASDYSENRFNNKLLDKIYSAVEKQVDRRANLVISNTHRAEKKRIEFGLSQKRSLVIPNGVSIMNPTFPKKNINKKAFFYVGTLNPGHGLFDFIRMYVDGIASLTVIGEGADSSKLASFCNQHAVKFTNHGRQSQSFVHKLLRKFEGLGLAPYTSAERYIYFCSPMKISEYIAYGVPVVTSNITEQS